MIGLHVADALPLTLPRARRGTRRRCAGAAPSDDDRSPRHVGVRRSRLPGGLPAFPLCRSRRAEGRHLFADRAGPAVQSELPHLQLAQQLHPQGRRGAGHGADLRHADGALRRRAGRHVRPRRRQGAALGRRPHLSLLHPARGQIPRRLAAHRARRRLLAQHPQGQGPSDHHPVAARFRRRRGGRRCDRHRALRAEARARRAAVRRRPADFLARLLFDKAVRRIDARRAARLRRLQGRPLRAGPLHRIRARQGLVGRRPAGRPRPEQFRYRALRILSRPRRRLRRLHRARIICSARSSPRAPGRRATISRP